MNRPKQPAQVHIDELVLHEPVARGPLVQRAIAEEVARTLGEAGVQDDSIDAELLRAIEGAMPR
jgi:DNA-binding transcriptional regulator YbjK